MATMNHYGNNHMLALEPRFMYDGAMAADAAAALVATDSADDGGATQPDSIDYGDSDALLSLLQSEGYVPPAAGSATELLFLAHQEVDSPETFLGQLPDDMAVIGLDSDASNGTGLDAITDALAQHTGIEAIHIVSHGQSGAFSLGDMQLSADNLLPDGTQYDPQLATQLTTWSEHLTDDADILIYGCDVADGATGQAFIQGIAELTGADVAASKDATGAAGEKGDWELEWKTGDVEAVVLEAGEYPGLLATDTIAVGDAGTAGSTGTAEVSGAEIGGAVVPLTVNATLDTDMTDGDGASFYDGGSITFEITNWTGDATWTNGGTDYDKLLLNLVPVTVADDLSKVQGELSLLSVDGRTDVYIGGSDASLGIGTKTDATLKAVKIGTIDADNDGTGGKPLTINFVGPTLGTETVLMDFEADDGTAYTVDSSGKIMNGVTDTGWTVSNQRYGDTEDGSEDLLDSYFDGTTKIDYSFTTGKIGWGQDAKDTDKGVYSVGDEKYTLPDGIKESGTVAEGSGGTVLTGPIKTGPGGGADYNADIYTFAAQRGGHAMGVLTDGTFASGYATVGAHGDGNQSLQGPFIKSEEFTLSVGEQIRFYAYSDIDYFADGADAYEIFSFLVDSSGKSTLVVAGRGDASGQWFPISSAPVESTDTYHLAIIAGSYDATGGGAVSTIVYIDSVEKVPMQFMVDETVIDAFDEVLAYQNTYLGSTVNATGSTVWDCATNEGIGFSTVDRTVKATLSLGPGNQGTGDLATDTDTTIYINMPPDGGDASVSVGATELRTITVADLHYKDNLSSPADNHDPVAVTITGITGLVSEELVLNRDESGETALTVGTRITKADLDAGILTFVSDPNTEEPYTVTITFQWEDDGAGETTSALLLAGDSTGNTNLDPCPNTLTLEVGAPPEPPEPPEESEELPPPVEPPPAPPPVVPDNTTVMTLNVGESVPVRNDPAPKPVSQPMSLGALNAPMGDLGGTEAPGITMDSYQTDAGVTLKIPPSIGKSFEGVVKTQAKAADSGLLPEGSVKFDPGSKFQKPSLEISNLDSNASGTTQVTVEGVNANGDTVQQTFEVTVEDGVVTKVKPLQGKGNTDKAGSEVVEEEGANGEGKPALKGKTTVEEGDGGDDAKGGKKGAEADADEDGAASDDAPAGELAPEGESGLPGGVIPQGGAFLWPPMEGLPLSGQLQQAAGGAFLARQASLLRAASAYHVHG
uniref:DUF4347 domain-containing protein n=1 Tax=Candidatus Kentrum sp. DK TaxID=2126562 RepID=A0A450SGT8_9GAMM|nr:MAG: protein of unknown function (DUF4347) [Candidatus Kentron sp. DK]